MESEFEGIEEMDVDSLTGQELQEMDIDQLDEVFSGASAPDVGEMSGKYRGTALAGAAHDYLPKPLKKAYAMFMSSPLFLWKGKEFEPGEVEGELQGKNLMVSLDSPVKLFEFVARIESAEFDGADCLLLDYGELKVPGVNLFRDELRKVNSFLYLGRGNLAVGDGLKFVVYFCLEPEY
ncbi:MAG: hypothetical protein ABIH66_04725 [bacterium]